MTTGHDECTIAQEAGAVNTTLFRSAFKADLGLQAFRFGFRSTFGMRVGDSERHLLYRVAYRLLPSLAGDGRLFF